MTGPSTDPALMTRACAADDHDACDTWRVRPAVNLLGGERCLCRCHFPADEETVLLDRLSGLLTRTASALKGPPGPLQMHDWSDLPAVAADLRRRADRVGDGRCSECNRTSSPLEES